MDGTSSNTTDLQQPAANPNSVDGGNGCLSYGCNFNQQNGEEKVAANCTGNSYSPEPQHSGDRVLQCSQSAPVSSGPVVSSNNSEIQPISGDVEGKIWSMKAIGKELRYVCIFLGTISVPWLVNPNGNSDVLNHWYLDFELYSFCITPFICSGVFSISFLDEKWNNAVSKRVLTCAIVFLGVTVMLPILINIIIGIVTKIKPTSTMSSLLVAVLLAVLVFFISMGVLASEIKVNAGDMESQRTSPNANGGSSIFPPAKGDMKKIFYGIAGLSVAYLTNPGWGSVDVLHHPCRIIQLAFVYVAFCSSSGMLVYLIIDDMKNQPSTTVPNSMMASSGLMAVLASSIAIITGMIDNVTPSPIPLVVWTVCACFLVIPTIVKLTLKKLTEKQPDGVCKT